MQSVYLDFKHPNMKVHPKYMYVKQRVIQNANSLITFNQDLKQHLFVCNVSYVLIICKKSNISLPNSVLNWVRFPNGRLKQTKRVIRIPRLHETLVIIVKTITFNGGYNHQMKSNSFKIQEAFGLLLQKWCLKSKGFRQLKHLK